MGMDKTERKKLGAFISLLGGGCFVLAALAAIWIAFFLSPEAKLAVLAAMGRFLRN
jgi:hypothetical protein